MRTLSSLMRSQEQLSLYCSLTNLHIITKDEIRLLGITPGDSVSESRQRMRIGLLSRWLVNRSIFRP